MAVKLSEEHYAIIRDEVDQPARWQRINFGADWLGSLDWQDGGTR